MVKKEKREKFLRTKEKKDCVQIDIRKKENRLLRVFFGIKLGYIFFLITQSLFGWGYSAHRMINERAISLLTSSLKNYFIKNKSFISENNID